jgi:REP element-mobilizing transposase RayT
MLVTTTVLDFVHAFHREDARDCMALHLARECKLEMAALYGYVVMPHHVHMIVRPRPDQTIAAFMSRFKPNTGAAVSRILSRLELSQFDQQRGLNRNTFWQRSFRSIVIHSEEMFWQKMEYIHLNPVRAGYVESPLDYVWSSARLVASGQLDELSGWGYKL